MSATVIPFKRKGLNVDLTKSQYMMLYNIVTEAMPKDYNPNFDVNTYDSLLDQICNATETYL